MPTLLKSWSFTLLKPSGLYRDCFTYQNNVKFCPNVKSSNSDFISDRPLPLTSNEIQTFFRRFRLFDPPSACTFTSVSLLVSSFATYIVATDWGQPGALPEPPSS